jgi:hypothetical protein
MRRQATQHRLRPLFAAMAGLCLFVSTPAWADSVTTTASGGYGRILFTLDPVGRPIAAVKDGVLTIHFARKVAVSARAIAKGLPGYISGGHADPNSKTYRFALGQPVRLHSSVSAHKFALDLVPASFSGTPPNLAPPPPPKPKAVNVAKLPPLKVRAGAYSSFTRLVFDWPKKVPYAVFPGDNNITIRFEAEARPNFRALETVAPPWVKEAGWRIEKGGTVIQFKTASNSGYHDFRDGTHIVLDILAPRTDASAYNPPADNGKRKDEGNVVITRADKKGDQLINAALADNILNTASALNGKPSVPAPTPRPASNAERDAALTPAKGANAPKKLSLPALEKAKARRIAGGAVITFPGAGDHGVAAFVRGMTAWVVLDGARPLDPAFLKQALGDFPSSVDVSAQDGVSVLRLGLKKPEQIAVRAEGSILTVTLAPKLHVSATGIELARDDDDPGDTSLVTLLPGAGHPVTLSDPAAGDTLTVVPGATGRAMLKDRRYVDFDALPTAAGLALTPFADDLKIAVKNLRVRIWRPGGLTLTPPEMPVAMSPAALARGGAGPSFIDFSGWSHPVKGDFLTEERKLREHAAHLAPSRANPARLTEARFYIANEFAAEALGLVNLMQASDPSLQNDMQLQTIKAAADVMMSRYRDGYNALSGSQFESDRNAALWRGLAEAGMANWKDARRSLQEALPVLGQYPPDWQARARIAYANAQIHSGGLEAADNALSHLPKDMPRPLFLQGELARARLDAAAARYRDAHVLFAAVKKSGDPRAVAQAIYGDTVAGLNAGAITQNQAIARLEKLRYRWRGDSLELKTLRKLGALYFEQKRWRDGLETLGIATKSFPNNDLARQAEDDMRGAFIQLFLKGKADKMPPIQALALFYDFIGLTPIGQEGDEMIRRMATRLVKVDLLGPAETLLKYQVDKRLNGVARAQVATRLAMINLLDHKAKAALAILRATHMAGLPNTMAHARTILAARALAALKQWNQALDLIAVDKSPETRRLRADIYWESGNWAVAAQKIEGLLGTRWQDAKPLTAEERHNVMRAAIAYSLANNEAGLDRLRKHFAAKMKKSPDGSAFAVVTQRIDTQGVAFRDIAGKIASIDTLQSFMKDFKKDYTSRTATN